MNNDPPKRIPEHDLTLELFATYKKAFLKFEDILPHHIRDIWIKKGDHVYPDSYIAIGETIPYKYEDPLYMKFVHRFVNCQYRPAQFYHQIDAAAQYVFLGKTTLNTVHPFFTRHCMVDFFAWISNMLGSYDVEEIYKKYVMKGSESLTNSQRSTSKDSSDDEIAVKGFIVKWSRLPIFWFYDLPDSVKKDLIEKFNISEMPYMSRSENMRGGLAILFTKDKHGFSSDESLN